MAVVGQFDGDVIVNGNLSMGSVTLPDSNITDAMVSGSADILATKLRHQFPVMFKEDTGSDVTSKTAVIHIAKGDGTIAAVEVAQIEAPETEKEYKKIVKLIAVKVSKVLGNTPAIAPAPARRRPARTTAGAAHRAGRCWRWHRHRGAAA